MADVVLQVQDKSEGKLVLFFDRLAGDVESVNVYVSLTDVTGNFFKVKSKIANIPQRPVGDERVVFSITKEEVQGVDASYSNVSFSTSPLFFRATSINSAGDESALAAALSKSVGVVGVTFSYIKDNPSSNAHVYGFSSSVNGWSRMATSPSGAVSVSQTQYNEDNYVIERTFNGTEVETELIYKASDPSGAYAKLVTYTGPWVGGVPTKTEYSDSVKP